MAAAAWTTLAAYMVQGILMMYLVRKLLKVHSLNPRFILPTVAYIVLASAIAGSFYFFDLSYFLDIVLKTLVLFGVSYLLFPGQLFSILNQLKSRIK